jgi:hypothetical protein
MRPTGLPRPPRPRPPVPLPATVVSARRRASASAACFLPSQRGFRANSAAAAERIRRRRRWLLGSCGRRGLRVENLHVQGVVRAGAHAEALRHVRVRERAFRGAALLGPPLLLQDLAADLSPVVLQPLPFPDRSVEVGAVEGGDKIVFVFLRVPAQKVQANDIADESLHFPRGLEPLPAQQQRPGRGTGCGPLLRHTHPCTGPTPRASKAEVYRSPVQQRKMISRSIFTRSDFPAEKRV